MTNTAQDVPGHRCSLGAIGFWRDGPGGDSGAGEAVWSSLAWNGDPGGDVSEVVEASNVKGGGLQGSIIGVPYRSPVIQVVV